jgi:hypothetical protein
MDGRLVLIALLLGVFTDGPRQGRVQLVLDDHVQQDLSSGRTVETTVSGQGWFGGWPCGSRSCASSVHLEAKSIERNERVQLKSLDARLSSDGRIFAPTVFVVTNGSTSIGTGVGAVDATSGAFAFRVRHAGPNGDHLVDVRGMIAKLPPVVTVRGPDEVECVSAPDLTKVPLAAWLLHPASIDRVKFRWDAKLVEGRGASHADVVVVLPLGDNEVRVVASTADGLSKPASISVRVVDTRPPQWIGPECVEQSVDTASLARWVRDDCSPLKKASLAAAKGGVRIAASDESGNEMVRFVPFCAVDRP